MPTSCKPSRLNHSSFFGLLIYYSKIKQELVYKYLGFLEGTFAKGCWYIFLATLAIAPYKDMWTAWLFGGALGACAVMNMMRYFGSR